MLNNMRSSFTYGMQLSDGSFSKTWDQVQAEGRVMRWLRTGHGCLCLEENHQSARSRMNLHLFMFWTQVRNSCHFIWIALSLETQSTSSTRKLTPILPSLVLLFALRPAPRPPIRLPLMVSRHNPPNSWHPNTKRPTPSLNHNPLRNNNNSAGLSTHGLLVA